MLISQHLWNMWFWERKVYTCGYEVKGPQYRNEKVVKITMEAAAWQPRLSETSRGVFTQSPTGEGSWCVVAESLPRSEALTVLGKLIAVRI